MDQDVIRAMLKWPNVPALYGWVRLDRRGHWRIQGERVTREVLVAFIGRNYAPDEQGRWYFQNGPQRGYVELDYTPWVLWAQPDGSLQTQTKLPVQQLEAAYLDEQGSLLLVFEQGVGLLADTDLDWAMARFRRQSGALEEAELASAIEHLLAGQHADLVLQYFDQLVQVNSILSKEVPERFGYQLKPAAGEEQQ